MKRILVMLQACYYWIVYMELSVFSSLLEELFKSLKEFSESYLHCLHSKRLQHLPDFFALFFAFDHIYQVSITLTLAQELIME